MECVIAFTKQIQDEICPFVFERLFCFFCSNCHFLHFGNLEDSFQKFYFSSRYIVTDDDFTLGQYFTSSNTSLVLPWRIKV